MKTIESILRFDLRPWLTKTNLSDDYYNPQLRQTPPIEEDFTTNYKIDFGIKPFSSKIKYYQRLIDNETTVYLNSFINELVDGSDNLIAFRLKKEKSKLKSLVSEINELITSKEYDLSLITSKHADFSTDRIHKESTFIFQYMLTAVIKCYLEIQYHFANHIHIDDKLEIAEIYSTFLNKPAPEKSLIQEVQKIIEQVEVTIVQPIETEPRYAIQYAQDKYNLFFERVEPYRFVELSKFSILNQAAQNRLIKELIENPVHYSVAMLDFLGYLGYLKKTYSLSKEKIYKHISQALKIDERTVKGNCLVLNPKSTEDRYKYQADQYTQKVEEDYNKILSGKPLE